ncbi:tRNA 5-methylaminomethyl-2-thiouridine biosynthesis bifunctional protein MnmC [subsurface metagenome]
MRIYLDPDKWMLNIRFLPTQKATGLEIMDQIKLNPIQKRRLSMFQKDVVIIGAGVTGCSIAYHLAKKGVPSQIVERDSIGARASGKAWAVFPYPPRLLVWEGEPADELSAAPKGGIKPWLELAWMSYYRLPDVALELKEKGGINVGYSEIPWIRVALSESEEKKYRHWLSLMTAAGYYESRWLEADDIKAKFPYISPQTRGGIVLPYRQVEPYEYTLGLAQDLHHVSYTLRCMTFTNDEVGHNWAHSQAIRHA